MLCPLHPPRRLPPPIFGLPPRTQFSWRGRTFFTVMSSSPAVQRCALHRALCPDSLHPLCKKGMAGGVHIFVQTISTVFLVLVNKSSKRPPHPPSLQVMASLFPHDNFIILFEYIYMLLSHT